MHEEQCSLQGTVTKFFVIFYTKMHALANVLLCENKEHLTQNLAKKKT